MNYLTPILSLSSLVPLRHLNAHRDSMLMSTIHLSKAHHTRYYTHLSFGISKSANDAQLAICEVGHLHRAGHRPLTPSTTDRRSKNCNLKYNILLIYSKCTPSCQLLLKNRVFWFAA